MGRQIIVTKKPWLMTFRALVLVCSSLLLQSAFRRLPLAETTALFFVTPLLVALLAGPLLGEKLRMATWLATLAGFCGALLIARPGGAMDAVGVAYTLGAALCYAIYQILTRKLSGSEPVMRQLFYTALVGTVVMTAVLPAYWTGTVPTPMQSLLIASLGIFAGTGHFLFIRAYRETPASSLSPMLYFQLVWVVILGWLVFSQLPDLLSSVGILIIGAAGVSLVGRLPRVLACLARPLRAGCRE
jgi:drug/metabolite transporter (DMT)-like permease